MAKVVCFGELLLRFSAPGRERLLQSHRLDVFVGGAEANVAVGLARFGHMVDYASVVADNALGRAALEAYMQFPNYVNSWRRLGFSEEDVKGSDRLVDEIVAWGGTDVIVDRVKQHQAAGADHVCLQVVSGGAMDGPPPRAAWRTLAEALL